MKRSRNKRAGWAVRVAIFSFVAVALCAGTIQWGAVRVSANHPVLVEGNCDSPVPGTNVITEHGTCGDYDGDGRIGTAEDTDGADRIFGTINAALGPGTGAAAGTGANHNGTITIIKSGRFAETIYIGQNLSGPGGAGVTTPINVTLEAAPGVSADINAVFQGDPAGGNASRQSQEGITVLYTTTGPNAVVTLRNLTVRNFATGIAVGGNSRVVIDNCRLENNFNHGIRVSGNARVVVNDTRVTATGFRFGPGSTGSPNPGNGISVEDKSQARILHSVFAQNLAGGISNNTGVTSNVQVFKVSSHFNAVDISGAGVTVAPDHNLSQN